MGLEPLDRVEGSLSVVQRHFGIELFKCRLPGLRKYSTLTDSTGEVERLSHLHRIFAYGACPACGFIGL